MDIVRWDNFKDWTPPNLAYLIDKGILYPQSRLFIFGKFKSWKSMVAMHTSVCLASGNKWFGLKTKQVNVLHIQTEISKSLFHKRFIKHYSSHSHFNIGNLYFASELYKKLDNAYGFQEMERDIQTLKAKGGLDVVVIDPIYKVISGDINVAFQVSPFLDRIDYYMQKYNLSFILCHHERKSPFNPDGTQAAGRGAEDMTGTLRLADWCDTAVEVSAIESKKFDGAEVNLSFKAFRNSDEGLHDIKLNIRRKDLIFELIMPEQAAITFDDQPETDEVEFTFDETELVND